jgi:hypothetical protein
MKASVLEIQTPEPREIRYNVIVVRTKPPPRLKLYWYSTADGDEDWFVVSRGAREARQWVAAAEGYGTGDVEVELIIPLPTNLQGTGEGWPDKDVLLGLGAQFVRPDTPRVVLLGERIFSEGMLESKVLRATDDDHERRGEGRPNRTPREEPSA